MHPSTTLMRACIVFVTRIRRHCRYPCAHREGCTLSWPFRICVQKLFRESCSSDIRHSGHDEASAKGVVRMSLQEFLHMLSHRQVSSVRSVATFFTFTVLTPSLP